MSPPVRHGTCTVCQRRYRLRADGNLRHHPTATPGWAHVPCPGVGHAPHPEDVPTGRFGGPRPAPPPDRHGPDPRAAAHRAALAAALHPRQDAA